MADAKPTAADAAAVAIPTPVVQHREQNRGRKDTRDAGSDSSRSPSRSPSRHSSSSHTNGTTVSKRDRHHHRSSPRHEDDLSAPPRRNAPESRPPPPPHSDKDGVVVEKRSIGGIFKRLLNGLFWLIVICAVGAAALFIATKPKPETITQTVFPIADMIPTRSCIPVSPEEIKQGSILNGSLLLSDLHISLIHHSKKLNVNGMCAQHLDKKKHCYCVLQRANGEYLDIYNLEMHGASFEEKEPIEETSVFCKRSVDTWRWKKLWVSYVDREGTLIERLFEGQESYVLQHLLLVMKGLGHCEDNNDSALLANLRDRVAILTQLVSHQHSENMQAHSILLDDKWPAQTQKQQRLSPN